MVVVKSPDDVFNALVAQSAGSSGALTLSNFSMNGKNEICALMAEVLSGKNIAAQNNALVITRPPLMIAEWWISWLSACYNISVCRFKPQTALKT